MKTLSFNHGYKFINYIYHVRMSHLHLILFIFLIWPFPTTSLQTSELLVRWEVCVLSSSSWPWLSKDLCGDISSCSNIICYWNLTYRRLIYWDFLRMICGKASKSVGGVFSGVSSGCLGQRTSQRTVSIGTASPQCGCSCGSSGSRTGRTFCHR